MDGVVLPPEPPPRPSPPQEDVFGNATLDRRCRRRHDPPPSAPPLPGGVVVVCGVRGRSRRAIPGEAQLGQGAVGRRRDEASHLRGGGKPRHVVVVHG